MKSITLTIIIVTFLVYAIAGLIMQSVLKIKDVRIYANVYFLIGSIYGVLLQSYS